MKELNQFLDHGFRGVFVCRDGRVISYRNGEPREMKPYADRKGYQYLHLLNIDTKERRHFAIHRLVAMAFLPSDDNRHEVNHKDRNKSNNSLDNLEWCTRKENVIHAQNPIRNNNCCELWYNGVKIQTFDSVRQACRFASERYGVGYSAMQKYKRSKGCEIRDLKV